MERPFNPLAYKIQRLSAEEWGRSQTIHTVGCDPSIVKAQVRLSRFALMDRPVLITGESGVGKELFARSLYLLSLRRGKPYLTVNCAQYHDENLLVSELFGHRKGSFTGAMADRRGLFEDVDGGVLFLDEVGELSPRAQAMLLRALSEGEIKPLGSNRGKFVDVRIVAATNRPLKRMVAEGSFREDLFYRLRHLQVHVPPVRARGDDWRLLVQFFLDQLIRSCGEFRRFSHASLARLGQYHWPGNVREIRSVVHTGYCLAEEELIEPADFEEVLERPTENRFPVLDREITDCYLRMLHEGQCFWKVVREPYMERDLNRRQVRAIIERGLRETQGSYKKLLELFRIEPEDYLKFMDFLRHHRLKPGARGKK